MKRIWIYTLKRILSKPPHVILKRAMLEAKKYAGRWIEPYRANRLTISTLLAKVNSKNLDELWISLSKRPYPAYFGTINITAYEALCPDKNIILEKAEQAINHQVNLLGSGLIKLGKKINWHKDYKSGYDWPPAYFQSINYNNPDQPSDVKFPWEVSRLQWLIPAGQAYLLTHDERYAVAVKTILSDWIANNPFAKSVNWTCTMEVALRILTWTWFFHVFHNSTAWQDIYFRECFLRTLFLHGDFTERHLEYSDVNGNHYTADAAGLVFAGLFFGEGNTAEHWQCLGWEILTSELPRQVFADGVDFEASVPYHRLVLELFLLPAFYRQICNLPVAASYRERVIAMTHFTAHYLRINGSVPLWGDADDARTLPFGTQPINDHRYLCGLVGSIWNVQTLTKNFSGPLTEIYWLLGPKAVQNLLNRKHFTSKLRSAAFPQGGFYIMRNNNDHIFIDCGPLGLAGRGGHGHNDCLSFEAVLDNEHLISDCGAYLYTASYQERNNFRSTAYHNTPQIDNEEINRFIGPDYLWNLHNDAQLIVHMWKTDKENDYFCGSHTGYERLPDPVKIKRTIILNHQNHMLTIQDEFTSKKNHLINIPLHFAPNVLVKPLAQKNSLILQSQRKEFLLTWQADNQHWDYYIEDARISPSYGVIQHTKKIVWQTNLATTQLTVFIAPMNAVENLAN